MAIWLSSDLHFNHDKEFIYGVRGFENIIDMNDTIITNFQSLVQPDDDLYLLGDIMLGINDISIEYFKQLPGRIHLIWGNHDTDVRKQLLAQCSNVVEVCGYATIIKSGKWHFYLSHYPAIVANYDDKKRHLPLMNLYGHIHQKTNFYNNNPYMYHVGVDSHNCFPVTID